MFELLSFSSDSIVSVGVAALKEKKGKEGRGGSKRRKEEEEGRGKEEVGNSDQVKEE